MIFFLNGCCIITTRDCNCNPPPPELSADALSWMAPYQNQSYFIFKNDTGLLDTLAVHFETRTEYCGGEECGSDCDAQIASLNTSTPPVLNFTISAKEQTKIIINNIETLEKSMYAELNTETQNVFVANASSTISLEQNFDWNNEFLTVLKIDCNDPTNCSKFTITNMLISKEKGLLQYRLNSGETWQLQE